VKRPNDNEKIGGQLTLPPQGPLRHVVADLNYPRFKHVIRGILSEDAATLENKLS